MEKSKKRNAEEKEREEKTKIKKTNNSKSPSLKREEESKPNLKEKEKRIKEQEKKQELVVGPQKPKQMKKQKKLAHETLYLERLPNAKMYEKSYMHREVVTHVCVTPTEFIITASKDGHLKFWKKQTFGIEFVKHYIAHLDTITSVSVSPDGLSLATCSLDKSIKIYDVINFGTLLFLISKKNSFSKPPFFLISNPFSNTLF